MIRLITLSALLLLSTGMAVRAEQSEQPEIPTRLPNPFNTRATASKPVSITEDLRCFEQTLYGESNDGKSDESRLGALEHTVYGAAKSDRRLTPKTRAEQLAEVVDFLAAGRKFYQEKDFQKARNEFQQVLKLCGKEWKSLIKAETFYRLGLCDYELSNIRNAGQPDARVNGALLRTSKENLTKACNTYKALGEPATAQEITTFIDSFKDKASTYFLY
ncbi:MAG: hypothetical protein K2Z81_15090 [Cyanobacteria bacterium]|nr:hypothetical protein [Cyanobacteriota bacterium]